MKLLSRAKQVIRNIAAKRFRRRNRIKGTASAARRGRNRVTDAEMLIRNNWGLRFDNPPPARSGAKRAAERLIKHRKQWSAK